MEALLWLMLVHYYRDCKRSTNAVITRGIDTQIRAMCADSAAIAELIVRAKKEAEAAKRKERAQAKKDARIHMHHGSKHIKYVPCGEDVR
ncbi:hypothetical protein ES703_98584 [subsurface metagenome]